LRALRNEGLNGIPGQIDSAPPRHISSAVGQIVDFMHSRRGLLDMGAESVVIQAGRLDHA